MKIIYKLFLWVVCRLRFSEGGRNWSCSWEWNTETERAVRVRQRKPDHQQRAVHQSLPLPPQPLLLLPRVAGLGVPPEHGDGRSEGQGVPPSAGRGEGGSVQQQAGDAPPVLSTGSLSGPRTDRPTSASPWPGWTGWRRTLSTSPGSTWWTALPSSTSSPTYLSTTVLRPLTERIVPVFQLLHLLQVLTVPAGSETSQTNSASYSPTERRPTSPTSTCPAVSGWGQRESWGRRSWTSSPRTRGQCTGRTSAATGCTSPAWTGSTSRLGLTQIWRVWRSSRSSLRTIIPQPILDLLINKSISIFTRILLMSVTLSDVKVIDSHKTVQIVLRSGVK